MKVGEPFYAAVYPDGTFVSSPESPMFESDEKRWVYEELKAWRIDPATVEVKQFIIVEAE